jgi:uncharacterized membrane protein
MLATPLVGSLITAYHGRDGHMGDDDWMWVFGPIMMIVWLALLALLVWGIVTFIGRRDGASRTPGPTPPSSPEEVLALRYARGEMQTAEYLDALEHLRARHTRRDQGDKS